VLYLIVLHPRPDVHHFTKGKPHSLPRGGIRSSRRVPTGPTAGHVHARGARGSEVRRQQKNRPEGRFLAGDVLVDHPDVGGSATEELALVERSARVPRRDVITVAGVDPDVPRPPHEVSWAGLGGRDDPAGSALGTGGGRKRNAELREDVARESGAVEGPGGRAAVLVGGTDVLASLSHDRCAGAAGGCRRYFLLGGCRLRRRLCGSRIA